MKDLTQTEESRLTQLEGAYHAANKPLLKSATPWRRSEIPNYTGRRMVRSRIIAKSAGAGREERPINISKLLVLPKMCAIAHKSQLAKAKPAP